MGTGSPALGARGLAKSNRELQGKAQQPAPCLGPRVSQKQGSFRKGDSMTGTLASSFFATQIIRALIALIFLSCSSHQNRVTMFTAEAGEISSSWYFLESNC